MESVNCGDISDVRKNIEARYSNHVIKEECFEGRNDLDNEPLGKDIMYKSINLKTFLHDGIYLKTELSDANCVYKEEQDLKVLHEETDIKEEAIGADNQQENKIECDYCHKLFNQMNSLMAHIRVLHKTKKIYECSHCQKIFKWKQNYNRHLRLHAREKPYECTACDYKCSNNYTLQYHHLTHSEKKEQVSLQGATDAVDEGRERFTCCSCLKSFTKMAYLRAHIRTIHITENAYECNLCGIKFKWKQNFKRHLRLHAGEKPFTCEICSYKFSNKCALKEHLVTHSDEKRYPCSRCSMKFKSKQGLKRHFTAHVGDKPMKCETCGKIFAHQQSLNTHVRRFHHLAKSSP